MEIDLQLSGFQDKDGYCRSDLVSMAGQFSSHLRVLGLTILVFRQPTRHSQASRSSPDYYVVIHRKEEVREAVGLYVEGGYHKVEE